MVDAREVMVREVYTIQADSPIDEAIDLIVDKKISGLPVVEGENRLVGVITEKDILRLLYDHVAGEVGHLRVGDLMTQDVFTFSPSDNLIEVCEMLANKPFRRVPLVEDGKIAGLISRRDIIRYIQSIRQPRR